MTLVHELAGTNDPMVIQAVEYGLREGYIVRQGQVPTQHAVSEHDVEVQTQGDDKGVWRRWKCLCGDKGKWRLQDDAAAYAQWLDHVRRKGT